MARFPKTLRSTQRAKHSKTEGVLPVAPSSFHRSAPRPVDEQRLSNITIERKRLNPHALAQRFTKFISHYTGQVKIPRDIVSSGREGGGRARLDVGQIPED
jgi:hypothetical protein